MIYLRNITSFQHKYYEIDFIEKSFSSHVSSTITRFVAIAISKVAINLKRKTRTVRKEYIQIKFSFQCHNKCKTTFLVNDNLKCTCQNVGAQSHTVATKNFWDLNVLAPL